MIVHAYFVDGSDMIVNYYEWSPDSLSYGDTEVTIRYSSGGVTDTATQRLQYIIVLWSILLLQREKHFYTEMT